MIVHTRWRSIQKVHLCVGSLGLSVIPDAAVTLSNHFSVEPAQSTLEYSIRWNELYPGTDEVISCEETAGRCVVSDNVNQIANVATVTWQLPETAGDYEIAIAASNYHYYTIARDRVTVE